MAVQIGRVEPGGVMSVPVTMQHSGTIRLCVRKLLPFPERKKTLSVSYGSILEDKEWRQNSGTETRCLSDH